MSQAVANKKKIFDSRYEILSIVGRGARSVVYHTITTTEPVEHIALKVLTNKAGDSSATEQLRKEALAMVASRHKYTVRLDDFHSLGQICYLAMEYAHLGDLRKYIAAQQKLLPIAQIERFLLQISEALAFMHAAGILHRDIKPDNILVVNERQSRLADFGVAILPGEPANLDELQKGVGTMDYMAPEVLEGIESTKRSDVYLLGVTFYEVLTGVQPFANIPLIEVITRRKNENITPPRLIRDEMPQYLEDIIMKAMAFDPAKRFESAEELLKVLNKHLSQGEQAPPASVTSAETTSTNSDFDDDVDLDKLLDELAKDIETEGSDPSDIDEDPSKALAKLSGQSQNNSKKRKRNRKRLKSASNLRAQDTGIKAQPPASSQNNKKDLDSFLKAAEQPVKETTAPLEPSTQKQPIKIAAATTSYEQDEESDYAAETAYTAPNTSAEPSVQALFGREQKPAPNKTQDSDNTANSAQRKNSTKNYQDLYREKDRGNSRGLFRFVLFTVLAIWLLDLGLKQWTDKGLADHALNIVEISDSSTEALDLFPKIADTQQLQFPDLPAGLYSGQISGLISSEPLTLLISRAQNSPELVIAVGLPGWKPARIKVADIEAGKVIIRSGGFILALEGNVDGQSITGKFKNSISGEEGAWSVTPIK